MVRSSGFVLQSYTDAHADPVVTPEAFAQSVVEDYALPVTYHAIITKSIQDQLSDFRIHSTNPDGEFNESDVTLVRGDFDEKDAAWWESWRKRLRAERRAEGKTRKRRRIAVKSEDSTVEDCGVPLDVDDIEVDEAKMVDDMRILIKVSLVLCIKLHMLISTQSWILPSALRGSRTSSNGIWITSMPRPSNSRRYMASIWASLASTRLPLRIVYGSRCRCTRSRFSWSATRPMALPCKTRTCALRSCPASSPEPVP